MKYIKLFENFEGEDKQKELAQELAAYFGVNLDTFAETSKIMAMSPEGIQRWFNAEMEKEEPNMPVIEELERLGYEFDLSKLKKNLFYAAAKNKVGLAKYLLDRGAEIEARDENQSTALHYAAGYNSLAVAELLLDRGADYEARDYEQWTPWDLANQEMQEALPQLNPNYKQQ